MNKILKIVLFILILLIVFGLGSWSTKYYYSDSKQEKRVVDKNLMISTCPKLEEDVIFQAGWEAAKKRMTDNGFFNNSNIEINKITGKIKKIDSNKFFLEEVFPCSPLADPDLQNRIVETNKETVFFQLIRESDDIFSDSSKQEIKKDLLKVGDQILIESVENLRDEKTINATKIILLEK